MHLHDHAFSFLRPRQREGLTVAARRNFLKASVAGIAGLSLPTLLHHQAKAATTGKRSAKGKSVLLLWMAGGPSHLDPWDPKPNRPVENRGPFGVIRTKVPGVLVCEHLPKQAAMMDRFTLIRSIDPRGSNHEPNTVFQTGNRDAAPRINPQGHLFPAIGSIVAKHYGASHPSMPPYATFMRSRSHLAFGGYLGKQYDPFVADSAARLPVYDLVGKDSGRVNDPSLFRLPVGLDPRRMNDRRELGLQLDRLRRGVDASGVTEAMDRHEQQALEMLLGRRMQDALDLSREPESIRDRYGKHLWCQQTLLARRMIEAGVSFVTIDLSYHTASGTWDTHGDNIPPYGGIERGLKPLLPLFDHLITTLVDDLQQRGKLDDVLILAMGEFGRTPKMGTQGSTDGRDHWPYVSTACLAGGGLKHGQVIGSSESDGSQIATRPVGPADLAATIYQHFGISLETEYLDTTGRPIPIVYNGSPVSELF